MTARLKGRRRRAEQAISIATSWASEQAPVTGLALVGSYAYGRPKMASDVDLVVLTSVPSRYVCGTSWIETLYPRAHLIRTLIWGPVTEMRLRLKNGLHVDVGITRPAWADVPLDSGTARVLSDGCRILYDSEGLLERALQSLAVSTLRVRSGSVHGETS